MAFQYITLVCRVTAMYIQKGNYIVRKYTRLLLVKTREIQFDRLAFYILKMAVEIESVEYVYDFLLIFSLNNYQMHYISLPK